MTNSSSIAGQTHEKLTLSCQTDDMLVQTLTAYDKSCLTEMILFHSNWDLKKESIKPRAVYHPIRIVKRLSIVEKWINFLTFNLISARCKKPVIKKWNNDFFSPIALATLYVWQWACSNYCTCIFSKWSSMLLSSDRGRGEPYENQPTKFKTLKALKSNLRSSDFSKISILEPFLSTS